MRWPPLMFLDKLSVNYLLDFSDYLFYANFAILFLMIETSRGGKCESNEWRHTGAPGIVLVTGRMWTGGGGIVSTKLWWSRHTVTCYWCAWVMILMRNNDRICKCFKSCGAASCKTQVNMLRKTTFRTISAYNSVPCFMSPFCRVLVWDEERSLK